MTLTGDVRLKRTKLPAATARSAAFKSFEEAYAALIEMGMKLSLLVSLFRTSLNGEFMN